MTTSGVNIRAATPADAGLIVTLIRELAVYEKLEHECRTDEAAIRHHLFGDGFGRGPVAECLIGEIAGRPEGFALFFTNFSTFLGKPGLYLEDLFVRPATRGHGLGKALLSALAHIARKRGYGRMEWAVLNWNEPAIGFYRKLGARPMNEWTVYRLTGDEIGTLAASTSH